MNARQARDGLPPRQRLRAMFVIEIALAMSVLDGAIANIALPTIAAELRTDPASAIWVVNAYQLAVTVSLLPFASLGELRGYRRVFGWGLAVFTLGSLACALSHSLTALIASRILQGFGGAGIMSVNNALVRFVYPRDQLGRGVAINALVGAISSAIGPSVAAAILSVAPWQWLFAINVPLGGIALALIMGALPRTPVAHHRFDWLSAVMSAATFGMLITGIDNLRRLSVFVALELSGAAVARCSLCLAPAAVALPYAGRRAVRTTGLRAVRRDVDLLIHRPEPRLCLAAFFLRGSPRPIPGRNRPVDDPMAGRGRFRRANRGMARRQEISSRHFGRDGSGDDERGPSSARLSTRSCGDS